MAVWWGAHTMSYSVYFMFTLLWELLCSLRVIISNTVSGLVCWIASKPVEIWMCNLPLGQAAAKYTYILLVLLLHGYTFTHCTQSVPFGLGFGIHPGNTTWMGYTFITGHHEHTQKVILANKPAGKHRGNLQGHVEEHVPKPCTDSELKIKWETLELMMAAMILFCIIPNNALKHKSNISVVANYVFLHYIFKTRFTVHCWFLSKEFSILKIICTLIFALHLWLEYLPLNSVVYTSTFDLPKLFQTVTLLNKMTTFMLNDRLIKIFLQCKSLSKASLAVLALGVSTYTLLASHMSFFPHKASYNVQSSHSVG